VNYNNNNNNSYIKIDENSEIKTSEFNKTNFNATQTQSFKLNTLNSSVNTQSNNNNKSQHERKDMGSTLELDQDRESDINMSNMNEINKLEERSDWEES